MLVPDLLRAQAERTPDQVALHVDGIAELRYRQWDEASNRLARGLVQRGLAPGDRVGLLFSNTDAHRFSIAYMAVHRAGGVNVPLNTRLSPAELRYIVGHCGAGALLHGRDDDGLATARAAAAPVATPGLVLGPAAQDELAGEHESHRFQVARTDDDLADILYTSGTTGSPKGVACEHGNITFSSSASASAMFRGQAFLHAVPVFTFAGAHAMMLIPLRGGMTTVVQPRFEPTRFLELLRDHKVAITFCVPSMLQLMLDARRSIDPPINSLRLLLYGTAPMPPVAIRRLPELFPSAMLVNMYGLTEVGAAVCSLPPNEAQRRPTSVGKPMPPAEARVVDDAGAPRPAGEPGEIQLRAPVRPRRYYRDDEATRATWTEDGWLRTGDVGYLDPDGYLYLVDRKKDLIIRGGFNITAAEIENVLLEHPRVREAAVIGVPHHVLGEDTKAFVVCSDEVSPAELEAYCREHLADYKVPRSYELVETLPRNALGKVLKRDLRGGGAA
jgi:acyl-CoA synthetase (AMP-forming)/AMP-acid ligase II